MMADHKDEIRRMLDVQRNDNHNQIEHHFRNTAKYLHMSRYPGHGAYGRAHAGYGMGYDGALGHPGGYPGNFPYMPHHGNWDPNLSNTYLAYDGK